MSNYYAKFVLFVNCRNVSYIVDEGVLVMKVYYQIKNGGDQPNSFWGSQLLQLTFIITSFGHFTHGQLAMCYYTPKELYNVHSFCY